MKRYIEILRKTVSVIVVTFLFVQFFTVSPLISEENSSDTNITENQTTETVDNNSNNIDEDNVNNESGNQNDTSEGSQDVNNTENNDNSNIDDSQVSTTDSDNALEYNIFTNTINNLTVTIKAVKGVFPEGTVLSVTEVNAYQQRIIDTAIEDIKEEQVDVVSSYYLDIKMLDSQGNEIQPQNGESVQISFTTSEVENANLNTNVYHIEENESEITASNLEVITEGDTATVETNGFSYYAIEFSQINQIHPYYMERNKSIKVFVICRFLNFNFNEIINVRVSNPNVVNLVDVGDGTNHDWEISGNQPFTTEYLNVTFDDGITYRIELKYIGVDNTDSLSQISDIVQGGSVDLSGNDSFVKDIPIQSIHIKDLSTITPELRYGTSGTLAPTTSYFQTFIRQDTGTRHNIFWGSTSGTLESMGGGPFAVGISSGGNPKIRRFYNGYYYYRFPSAAILPDGTTADVLVKYEDIYNYSNGSLRWVSWSAVKDYPALWPYATESYTFGIQANITALVVQEGTQNPVDTSNLVNGNYIYAIRGIDNFRTDDDFYGDYHTLDNSGSYNVPSTTPGTYSGTANYNYSESVQFINGSYKDNIYIPKPTESGLFIDNDGRMVAAAAPSDVGEIQPYMTGVVTLGKVSGTSVTAYSSARDKYYDINDNLRGIYFMTPIAHSITASTGINGSIDLWDDGNVYVNDSDTPAGVNKLMDRITNDDGPRTFSVPNGKTVTYKLIPNSGYTLRSLTVNGSLVNAIAYDAYGNPASGNAQIGYYTYTFNYDVNTDQILKVEWKSDDSNCTDCKNIEACENCYLALNGDALNNYTYIIDGEPVTGVYRGNNARSKVNSNPAFNGETIDDNTFASPLPYGNIFIDTSMLVWDNDNIQNIIIDKADSRFKFVGTGKTATQSSTAYPDAVGIAKYNKDDYSEIIYDADLVTQSDIGDNTNNAKETWSPPAIAYYGPIHSYLMYGDEEDVVNSGGSLVKRNRDNTPAIDSKVANGIYTVNENGENYSVNVSNGTNLIEPIAGKDYLYKVTYKNAAILQDGSRGDLVLTVKKVEIESSYTSDGNIYVGLQRANEIQVAGDYIKEGQHAASTSRSDVNAVKYIPGRESIAGIEVRNAIGAKTTYEISVKRSDGTPVNGIISYAAKDLDISSYESIWGRKPSDTYQSNGGTNANIVNNETTNAWTGTYQFYDYAEGMAINSGALSYALIPKYTHDTGSGNYDSGRLPINQVIDYYNNLYSSDTYSVSYFEAPLQVQNINNNDLTANGLRFVTTGSGKARNNDGNFTYRSMDIAQNGFSYDGNLKYRAQRPDDATYDTGFAVLLDSKGSEFTWTGSNHTNGSINTDLFDTTFVQYLRLSHGTGGGIYVEDYDFKNGCNVIYRENLVTIPLGSSTKTTLVPEDGYRIGKFTIDDVIVTINYESYGIQSGEYKPVSVTFKYHDGSEYTQAFNSGGVITRKLDTQWDYDQSKYLAHFDIQITKNDDGIFDVDIYNRRYESTVNDDNRYATNRHNIHVDFDTDYYFTKIWADAASADAEDIPTSLTLVASPYVIQHNYVVIGNTVFNITTDRTMHLDKLNDKGEKETDQSGKNIKYNIETDGLVVNITGIRQNYPIVRIDEDLDGTDDAVFVIIDNSGYRVKVAADGSLEGIDTDVHPKDSNDDYTNPYLIIRTEDGYMITLPHVLDADLSKYLVHHVTKIHYEDSSDPTNYADTTDNPEYGDVLYVSIATRPQNPYSRIVLNGDTYVITGNSLYKVIQDSTGLWVEDLNYAPIPISHEFERYNDGDYITKKIFTVRTDADINSNDKANELKYAAAQQKYINAYRINDGQDLVWKIKYPSKGLDVDGDGVITDNGIDWPALSIETEHIYDDMHEISVNHVDRLYWFVNERLGSLTGKWALEGYTNTNEKVAGAYTSNSEVPGYASYRDSYGNIKYVNTYFYQLSTENRNEVSSELGKMANIRLAFMSPISEQTIRNSSYHNTYGLTYYTEWGGVIVNSIHQSKLWIEKTWVGGDDSERKDFVLTINREYNYAQLPYKDAIAQGKKVVTIPEGNTMNGILLDLLNNNAGRLKRIRNGAEPLDLNKEKAKIYPEAVDSTRLYKIPLDNGSDPAKDEGLYIWFDDALDGTIYFWSDADEVYLPKDSSSMFRNFPNLELVSGLHNLNTSKVEDMSYMFAVDDENNKGKIQAMYNFRDWDVMNVRTFEGMFQNQGSLTKIHGIIDWDLSSGDNFIGMFKGVPAVFTDGSKHPFIWYPNVYIGSNGDVLTPTGVPLTLAYSKTSDGTARDLIWDSGRLSEMAPWWNNGKNTPTNYNDNKTNTTWVWDIEDEDLAFSDASKWTYRVYENNLDGYSSVEGATSLAKSITLEYNILSGKWEAALTNVKTADVNIKKKTIDDIPGEFKFRIKFNTLFNPDDKVEDPKEDTIVVTKRFVDEDGNYLDLSEDVNDYFYIGNAFVLTLYSGGSGTDPANYQEHVTGKAFPEGWTRLENGTWTYTFTDIDDTVNGYLITEPANVTFRYKGGTDISSFKLSSGTTSARVISQDKTEPSYHSTSFRNVSTVGEKTNVQRINSNSDYINTINTTYEKEDGIMLERYVSFDGEQYDTYDVLIGVDKEGKVLRNPDGSLKSFKVWYGGVDIGHQVAFNYPFNIYTSDGSNIPIDTLYVPTYDENTQDVTYVDSYGLHVLTKTKHTLNRTEPVGSLDMIYDDAKNNPYIDETKCTFVDASDSDITYKYNNNSSKWEKWIPQAGGGTTTDDTWSGEPPLDSTATNISGMYRTIKIWDRNVATRRSNTDSDYKTSGKYTVTDPESGVSEEYYIVEQHGGIISAEKYADGSLVDIGDVISSISFNADTGDADFTTSDGEEYIFSSNGIRVVPNIWEFTLKNGQDLTIPDIPLGTSYEVWEYGLDNQWHLINLETYKVNDDDTTTDPTASTIDSYFEKDVDNIKRYTLQYNENPNGNYYQLIESYTSTEPSDKTEYETYSNDISVLMTYRKAGYISDQNGNYYKLVSDGSYTNTAPTSSNANNYFGYDGVNLDSITRYKENYKRDNSGTGTVYYRQIFTKTAPTASTAYNYVGYDGNDINSVTKYKKEYTESKTGRLYLKEDGTYTTELPIVDAEKTTTGVGGVHRFVGNTETIRHIFTNENDAFNLTVSKTVKGNQGSKDQYFKFIISISDAGSNRVLTLNTEELTTSFSFKDDKNGEYYKLKDGRYTQTEPTAENKDIYVLDDENNPKKYKAIKPNMATNFINYIMQNENNRDDDINQRDDNTDYLTYKEALSAGIEKNYTFKADNTKYPDHDDIYIYDTTASKWLKYTWEYVLHNAGPYYKVGENYTLIDPDSTTIVNYDGYDVNTIDFSVLKGYSKLNDDYVDYIPGTTKYYLKVNGDYVTDIDISNIYDYVGAFDIALESLNRYEAGYVEYDNEQGANIKVPDDAIYSGIGGQQIITSANGSVSFNVYMKHGESVTLSGLPIGTKYTIQEVIDGLVDYNTTVADGNDKALAMNDQRAVSGEIGKNAQEDSDGHYYKINSEYVVSYDYERPGDYYTDYHKTNEIDNLPKYKAVYSDNANGEYYKKRDVYTKEAPTLATAWLYEGFNGIDLYSYKGYDGVDVNSIKVAQYNATENPEGDKYKQLFSNTRAQTIEQASLYEGFDGTNISSVNIYGLVFEEDPNGEFYKYKYSSTLVIYPSVSETVLDPSDSNISKYEGYDGSDISSIKKYSCSYKLIDGNTDRTTYTAIAYKYINPVYVDKTSAVIDENAKCHLYEGYIQNDNTSFTTYDVEELYELMDGTYTNIPPNTPDGFDLSTIKKYRIDFVEDPDGTFYKVNTSSTQIEDGYTEVSPAERYDLSKKYNLNATVKYTNTKDGIVPTKAFIGYFMPVIIMNFIALCYVLYDRRKKRLDILDE